MNLHFQISDYIIYFIIIYYREYNKLDDKIIEVCLCKSRTYLR